MITTKTPESLFLELGQEFTDLAMDTNAKLIVAVEEEKFEDAAKHRDFLKTVIENTVQMSMILLTLDETTIRESFTRQNEIIYNVLLEEYHNPTEPEVIYFEVGDVVSFEYKNSVTITGTIGEIEPILRKEALIKFISSTGEILFLVVDIDKLTKIKTID